MTLVLARSKLSNVITRCVHALACTSVYYAYTILQQLMRNNIT